MPQATIIDTDIGDDVDDSYALALALASPELRVVGITTVSGPTERRARLAQTLLASAGRSDIPVAVGSSTMTNGRPGPGRFSHASALAPIACLPPLWPGTAVDLLLKLTTAPEPGLPSSFIPHPSSLIICLGPLTNLALALARDPTLAQRMRVVAMAGKLGLPYPDWNLRCDPAAARAVLASGVPLTLVGMHVTMRCQLTRAELRRIFEAQRPVSDLLARCTVAWRTWQRRLPILHDALTVALACDPTLACFEPRRVLVGAYGFSLALRGARPNALVCRSVDQQRLRSPGGFGLLERMTA